MVATFQEVRQCLSFEALRRWPEMAIHRPAPALLGLFSVVFLFAHQHMAKSIDTVRQTAWYRKSNLAFSDALAPVRRRLWAQERLFCGSSEETETVKVPRAFMERLTDTVCYAA